MLLIAMEESRQKSYAEVANVLYGTRAGITVDVTIALYNFGVLVSYVTWLKNHISTPFFWAACSVY
jgi:amino acid permease